MLKYTTFTDKGSRECNEDYVLTAQHGKNHLFVLCDGLGGHGMGDEASRLVCEVFQSQFMKAEDMSDFLGQTFLAAQDILLAEQINRHAEKKMRTTAVVCVTDENNAYIGHVGDSRCYIFHHNRVKDRTLDHSIPQMMALSHKIKESQIRNHPDRNIVLRAMGEKWEEPRYELKKPIPLKKCQGILLCSDGFWELIVEKEMCALLKKSGTVEEWINSMAQCVRANGKNRNMDNYSAIAMWNE